MLPREAAREAAREHSSAILSSPFLSPSSHLLSPPLLQHPLHSLQLPFELLYPLCLLSDGGLHILHQLILLSPVASAHSVHALLHSALLAETVFEDFQIAVHQHVYLAAHRIARVGHFLIIPFLEEGFVIAELVASLGELCIPW